MKKLIVTGFGLAALLLSSPSLAHSGPATAEQNKNARKLLFDEEFDGSTLDRSKWNVEGPEFWVNNELQAYVDAPETIRILPAGTVKGATGGVLILQPHWVEHFTTPTGRKTNFVSGRINTKGKFAVNHGRIEARIRMPDAAGVWPAFWLLGGGNWPATGEVDIMEYVGEKDWVGVAMHGPGYSGETPLVNKFFFDTGTDVTQWHDYAVEWEKNQLLFEIDGRLIYRVTRPMVEYYGKWRFDNPKHIILNFAVGGVYPLKTNGITKPFTGLPQATVDKIKQGQIALEVDWVRVYAPKGE